MQPFRYRRATRRAARDRAAAPAAAPTFIAGGTNLIDLMKLERRAPARARRHQRACRSRTIEATPAAALRIGALARNSDVADHPLIARALPGAVGGAAVRRVAAAAQHGDGRRQPAAAHALPVLPRRRRSPCNKRAARLRLRRASTATTACTPSSARSEQCIADAPVGHVRRAGRRSTRSCTLRGPQGDAHDPDRRLPHACPAITREIETVLEPGELITARRRCRPRRSRRARATSRCAIARRSRSRWRRRRSRSMCTAARSATRASRSAGSRPSRGARARPRRRCIGQPARRATFARARPMPRCDGARPRGRQRVQGRARASGRSCAR